MERAPVACPSAATLGGPSCAPRGAPAASWWPLARIGAVDLYLAPPGSEQRRAGAVRHAGRRGQARPPRRRRLRRRGRAGPDRRVSTPPATTPVAPPARPYPSPPPPRGRDADAIRVAVVDVVVRRSRRRCRRPSRDRCASACPATTRRRRADAPAMAPGHGTAMAGVVLAECPGAHVGLFQIAGVGGRRAAVPGAGRSRRGGRGGGRGLAGRRRPHRDERRRLGDAALSARRAARGGAVRAARAGHVDLLLRRRSVAQPRPPGRQRRAGRRRPRQPALGARDRGVRQPRRLVSRLSRLRLPRVGGAARRTPAARPTTASGPAVALAALGRAAALERAHRRRRLQPGHRPGGGRRGPRARRRTATSPPRSCARCWR